MSARVFKPITFAEIPKIRKSPNIEGNFVYKGFAKVRRSLFNPDPDDARRFIDEELTKLTNDQCDKWNFDFVTCKPKEIGQYTRYEWTPITPPIIRTPVCSLKSRILENDGHNAFLYPPIASSSPSALDDEMLSELTDIRTRSIPKKQSLITDFMQTRKKREEPSLKKKLKPNNIIPRPKKMARLTLAETAS